MVGKKIQLFCARIVRACTPVLLSTALAASGCDTQVPHTAPAEVELRAHESGPSKSMLEQGPKIAQEIVEDEAFAHLVEVAAEIGGDLRAAQSKHTPEELDAIIVTTTSKEFEGVMGGGELLSALGGDPEKLQEVHHLIDELVEKHGLETATSSDVGYVFELALASGEGSEMLELALEGQLLESPGWNKCESACWAGYMVTVLIATTAFIVAMVLATVTAPFGLLIVPFAIAVYNRVMTQALLERDVCLAACEGVDLDLSLCGDTLICDEDEYCWEGPLGIGKDECRETKDLGRTCSDHDMCTSGCCKFHLWSNPISNVCRPASKCD